MTTEAFPFVLKQDNWPQADRTAWDDLFADGGLFDDSGRCRHWSEGTRTKRRQGYGQWLSYLKRLDPLLLALAPTHRITEDRVRGYVKECEARLAPKSIEGLVGDLLFLAINMDPDGEWAWLRMVFNRLGTRANRHSLPPPHPISVGAIFHWSLTRMSEVANDPNLQPLNRAVRFRQALMIGFLIARPVRRRALLAMTSIRHLVEINGRFELRFAAEDMKDAKARQFPLPKELIDPMRRYLDEFRPYLLDGKPSDGLWISQYGKPLTPDGYSRELPKITERHLEVTLRPHGFRHVAATSIAEYDPEHVGIIRDILGHTTDAMAEEHYNRASHIGSCNAFQSVMENIASEMPKIGPVKRTPLPATSATPTKKKRF
ncbi:tyrosine-type recombinase/integrase [Tateyamaria sp.]|uniref:tyrosine-type recombinase/integrase n=1 Tax=Tateyamaria sp. TaxID=1929288 RepID=UPI0032A0A2F3